ncbi:MAG TPA: MBL fold metallo-hydrolase [Acidimicrobiia bacterium]|nr:MBL fold metallo-hydrolase [Acidimicrobiia bacterium]
MSGRWRSLGSSDCGEGGRCGSRHLSLSHHDENPSKTRRSRQRWPVLDEVTTRTLKWIAVSHYDADHLGGILDVANAPGAGVGAFYDRGGGSTAAGTQTYAAYCQYVTSAGTRHPVDIGDSFSLCSGAQRVTFTVVSAGTDGTAAGGVAVSEENDRRLCLHVDTGTLTSPPAEKSTNHDGPRTDAETAVASTIGDVEVAR